MADSLDLAFNSLFHHPGSMIDFLYQTVVITKGSLILAMGSYGDCQLNEVRSLESQSGIQSSVAGRPSLSSTFSPHFTSSGLSHSLPPSHLPFPVSSPGAFSAPMTSSLVPLVSSLPHPIAYLLSFRLSCSSYLLTFFPSLLSCSSGVLFCSTYLLTCSFYLLTCSTCGFVVYFFLLDFVGCLLLFSGFLLCFAGDLLLFTGGLLFSYYPLLFSCYLLPGPSYLLFCSSNLLIISSCHLFKYFSCSSFCYPQGSSALSFCFGCCWFFFFFLFGWPTFLCWFPSRYVGCLWFLSRGLYALL